MRFPRLTKLRTITQIVFFLLFLFLLLRTEFRGSFAASSSEIRLPYAVSLFFRLDPLVAIANALSSRALYRGLLWSLLVLIPTMFLGRFFCGWICPLGSIHHFFSGFKSERKRGKQLIESNRYRRWQTTKYYLLIVCLVAAVFGTGVVGWLDPFSFLVRSVGLSILPATNYGVRAFLNLLERSHYGFLQTLGSALHFLFGSLLLSFKQPYFRWGIWLGIIFICIVALNARITRFWCRALCPLGALLGLVSRWSVFGLVKNPEHCNDCNRCLLRCQGGDDPIGGVPWHQSECLLCLNCVAECPEHGLRFEWFPNQKTVGANLQRRKVLTGLTAGAALVPLMRSTPGFAVQKNERLLRPPGALDEAYFLSRCIRCGECMKVCPNNALHPACSEAGVEGLWTPVLVPRIGYCEPSCVLCSQVCPTGAIWEITGKEKGWSVDVGHTDKPIRLGTAFYDRGRCLPWAMATECIVCEEWCPTSPKAIYLETEEVIDAAGNVKELKQPHLDPSRCVGCGACEYACPVQDRPAVYVTSVGESRSRTNQILLNRSLPNRSLQSRRTN
ncbi:MAG TPA: 4Fe-4S binding protein [Verrucomicrobiae bacterium]|nr:4Fe-4S binding protein [Verrucomicrobiae bacterium]